MKIALIADSAADITKEEQERYNVEVLPFLVSFGDATYRSGIDISNEDFYKKLRECEELPKTSQISPADIEDAYRKTLTENDAVIHVTIASEASGTYNTACFVAQSLRESEGADITVIDSRMLSIAIGVPVVNAAKMLKGGSGKDEVIEYLTTTFNRDTAYFMVDDLRHLKKGGRIRATAMIVAELFDIKPICVINRGLVEAFEKVRGTKKAISRLVDMIEERALNPKEHDVNLIVSDEQDKTDFLIKLINERIAPKSINVYNVGATIATHSGPSVVGVYFVHK